MSVTERLGELLTETLSSMVDDALSNMEISTDSIEGLDDAMANFIENWARNNQPCADDIDELDSFIMNTVKDRLREGEFDISLREILSHGEFFPDLVARTFNHPTVQAAFDQALRESAVRVLLNFLVGTGLTLPVNSSVQQPDPPIVPPDPTILSVRFNGEGGIVQDN